MMNDECHKVLTVQFPFQQDQTHKPHTIRRIHLTERGVVTWFNDAKGVGFIKRRNGQEIFVHYKSIVAQGYKTLNEGDPVQFEVIQQLKGLRADRVVKVV